MTGIKNCYSCILIFTKAEIYEKDISYRLFHKNFDYKNFYAIESGLFNYLPKQDGNFDNPTVVHFRLWLERKFEYKLFRKLFLIIFSPFMEKIK